MADANSNFKISKNFDRYRVVWLKLHSCQAACANNRASVEGPGQRTAGKNGSGSLTLIETTIAKRPDIVVVIFSFGMQTSLRRTGGVDASIEQVAKVLSEAELDLTRVSHQLELYYTRVYSSVTHTNVYALVQRLRAAQKHIDDLVLDSIDCDRKRAELINMCRSDLNETYEFAKRAQGYEANDSGSLTTTSAHRFANLDARYLRIVSENIKANDLYLQKFDPIHRTEDTVISSINSDVSAPSREQSGGALTVRDSTQTCSNSGTAVIVVDKEKKSDKEKRSAEELRNKSASQSTASSSQDRFKLNSKPCVVIDKAAFNRLPRNLKIKAGKLAEVNAFYEKVCQAFADRGNGPLPDKQLMNATGESSLDKFDVLRGLSVLRKNKQGWILS